MKSVGIIGSGRWGRNIARSFSKKRNVKRVVSAGNELNLEKIRTILPNIIFSSIDDLLGDDEIDCIVIAVPIDDLPDIAVQCLEHNKHILLEKPAAASVPDIERIECARDNKVCLVNYLYLADPAYMSFKHALTTTKIQKASFVWKKWGSFDNDILLNLASHELSILFDSLGTPDLHEKSLVSSSISDDACILSFSMGEVEAVIDIDRKSKTRHKTVVYETENGLYMWTPGFFAHDEVEVSSNAANNLLDIQRDNFLSLVDNNMDYNNLDLSKKILKFIDGVRQ